MMSKGFKFILGTNNTTRHMLAKNHMKLLSRTSRTIKAYLFYSFTWINMQTKTEDVFVTKLVDRPLAGVRAEGGVLTGRFRRGLSPAARVKGPERFTRSGRTCGWAWEAERTSGRGSSA